MAMSVKTFKILGYEAILFDGRIEISVPDENIGTDIVLKLSNAIMDNKFKSLRINLPNKIIFISAKDRNHLKFMAQDTSNGGLAN
jgi:hypothetical protein